MSYAHGQNKHGRDIGYSVPAYCDRPGCQAPVDRGLAFTCGMNQTGGAHGCGLHFCDAHLRGPNQTCERCAAGKPPFKPKDDHPDWVNWKLTHESWQRWREENPDEVERLEALRDGKPVGPRKMKPAKAADPAPTVPPKKGGK